MNPSGETVGAGAGDCAGAGAGCEEAEAVANGEPQGFIYDCGCGAGELGSLIVPSPFDLARLFREPLPFQQLLSAAEIGGLSCAREI
jgi:hypothetical protein